MKKQSTIKELKKQFDLTISKMICVERGISEWPAERLMVPKLYVGPLDFDHIKYCCTTEEKQLQLRNGKVYYRGFEVCRA